MSRFSLAPWPSWTIPWRAVRLAHWRSLAQRVQRTVDQFAHCTDDELKSLSLTLRYRARSGTPLLDLAVEGFSLVAAACQRVHGLRVYDEQLWGAFAMQSGAIAVMQTGEGKTFAALFPLYLNALVGRGAHLITANDYLAARDAAWASPILEKLGLKVAAIQSESSAADRYRSYRADVTYATAKEVGFDFLRDRLRSAREEFNDASHDDRGVLREFHFALIDEADNILIDEARTPLVVSARPRPMPNHRAAFYRWAAENSVAFEEGKHFESDLSQRRVNLNESGRRLARTLRLPPVVGRATRLEIYEQLELALQTRLFYEKDRHYVIRDGEIVIVDEGTGRLAEGRKWRAGLHQAIEAREGLPITEEGRDAARITIQSLFRRYKHLAGMTGTVAHSASELRHVYQAPTWEIPTHRPSQRIGWPDLVFVTEAEKWEAIVRETSELHAMGRPVLLGTRSIQKSEMVSQLLSAAGIPHQVLNARHLSREAEIIAAGGRQGKVTVATNMAGRGTDIRLDDAARSRGGLHVICSELHDSARIDRQLIGRCARQGDPGTYRHFHSLDDDLLKLVYSPAQIARIKRWACQSRGRLDRLAACFRRAQLKVERRHAMARQMLLHREEAYHDMQREIGGDPYLELPGD